jgi:hypothetical protein
MNCVGFALPAASPGPLIAPARALGIIMFVAGLKKAR